MVVLLEDLRARRDDAHAVEILRGGGNGTLSQRQRHLPGAATVRDGRQQAPRAAQPRGADTEAVIQSHQDGQNGVVAYVVLTHVVVRSENSVPVLAECCRPRCQPFVRLALQGGVLVQLASGRGADGPQQSVVRPVDVDEAACGQHPHRLGVAVRRGGQHGPGHVRAEPAGKDRQHEQRVADLRFQAIQAPLQHGVQAPLPRLAAAPRERVGPRSDDGEDLMERRGPDLAGRELDRQGQAVQCLAQLEDQVEVGSRVRGVD